MLNGMYDNYITNNDYLFEYKFTRNISAKDNLSIIIILPEKIPIKILNKKY